jgi:hypothetical protein
MRHFRRCRYYRHNPVKLSDLTSLESQLAELEVSAARTVVSLATYLRVALYVKKPSWSAKEANLHKKLASLEPHLDILEKTGAMSPELGYPVFTFLESNRDHDVIDPIFIEKMKSPPLGGGGHKYWKAKGAIGVKDVAYIPWTTNRHLELLRSYNITDQEKEIIAYHVRGPLLEEVELVEGLDPIMMQIGALQESYQQLAQEYTAETGNELDLWGPHQHTEQLPLMIDLLNEYLSGEIILSSSDVWLKRTGSSIKSRGKATRKTKKKTTKKKATKKKTTKKKATKKRATKKKATKKKATKKKATKKKATKKKATKKKATKKKTPKKRTPERTQTDIKLGDQVKEWREQNKISKKSLAENLKVPTHRLTRFEQGYPVLNDEQLAALMELIR